MSGFHKGGLASLMTGGEWYTIRWNAAPTGPSRCTARAQDGLRTFLPEPDSALSKVKKEEAGIRFFFLMPRRPSAASGNDFDSGTTGETPHLRSKRKPFYSTQKKNKSHPPSSSPPSRSLMILSAKECSHKT